MERVVGVAGKGVSTLFPLVKNEMVGNKFFSCENETNFPLVENETNFPLVEMVRNKFSSCGKWDKFFSCEKWNGKKP